MFKWFKTGGDKSPQGIQKIRQDFLVMLETAKHEFHLAASAALCGVEFESVREELLRCDKEVNRFERKIRKALVVHCSVRQMVDPESLVMMSIAKDAERLGDYSKNIFDMAKLAPIPPTGDDHERLLILQKLINALFEKCAVIFQNCDERMATDFIREATWIARQCDTNTERLLRLEHPDQRTASDVLMFRYMKRMASHLRNICSSVVQPVHKIDFTSKLTRDLDNGGDLLDLREE